MTKLRAWAVAALLAVLVIVAAGWFLALSPQKSKVASLHDQTTQQQDANAKLTSQIALLKKQQSQIPAEQARIAQIKGRIPDTPQVTTYVRTLTSLAAATNVELVSIAPSPPALVQVAPTQPTAASAPTGPVAAASTTTASSGLSTISVAINVVGDYYSVQQFLSKLEDTKRITTVSAISLKPGTPPRADSGPAAGAASPGSANDQWKTLSAVITASIFMSAAPVTTAGAGTAQAPATAPSAAKTPTASPASTPAASK